MTERRNAAVVLAMCAWTKKRIAKIEEQARRVADVSFPDEKTAAALDGTVVGYTSRVSSRPKERFTILNEGSFVAWVMQRWPTEVEMRVRPAFIPILADIAERHGGVLIDDDGEVCEHVKLNDNVVSTRTYLTKTADAALASLLGRRTLDDLLDFINDEDTHNLNEEDTDE